MPDDIYDPTFVASLFDRMSGSYTRVNRITSFGFSERWPYVFAQARTARLTAIDFSPERMR